MKTAFSALVRVLFCLLFSSSFGVAIAQLKNEPKQPNKTFEQSADGVWTRLFGFTVVKKGTAVFGIESGFGSCFKGRIRGNSLSVLEQAKFMYPIRPRPRTRKNAGDIVDFEFVDIPQSHINFLRDSSSNAKNPQEGWFAGDVVRLRANSAAEYIAFLRREAGDSKSEKDRVFKFERCIQFMDGSSSGGANVLKPDLSAVITKWENVIPAIRGLQSSREEVKGVDGGWAVNLTAVATVEIVNFGGGKSPTSNLNFQLIKGQNKKLLHTESIKELSSGERIELKVNLKFPNPAGDWDFFGPAEVLPTIDPENRIEETEEENNGAGIRVYLVDPRPERFVLMENGDRKKVFASEKEAERYLINAGFNNKRWGGVFDTGWTKELPNRTKSRWDGQLKPLASFRMDGNVIRYNQNGERGFLILIQGTEDFGEPNPFSTDSWGTLPGTGIHYVGWWHRIAGY